MKLDEEIKFLDDINPTQELLDYDFKNLITNETYSVLNIFPPIFGKLRTYSIVHFPVEHWQNEQIVRSSYKLIKVSSNNYPDRVRLHNICMNNVEILEYYYNAIAKNAVLDILPPNESIKQHSDISVLYTYCHRVHLPIVTNSKVFFYVNRNKYIIPKGKFFEFSNKDKHAVQNTSNETRIHLVVDLLPKSNILQ